MSETNKQDVKQQILLWNERGEKTTISELAALTGRALRDKDIYSTHLNEFEVRYLDNGGLMQRMTKTLFPSWVEKYVEFGSRCEEGVFHPESISTVTAAQILVAEQFHSELRDIISDKSIKQPLRNDRA